MIEIYLHKSVATNNFHTLLVSFNAIKIRSDIFTIYQSSCLWSIGGSYMSVTN